MTQMPFGPPEHHDRRWREPRFTLWLKSYGLWVLYWVFALGLATIGLWEWWS